MARKATAASRGHHEADHLFEMICRHLEHLHGEIDQERLRQAYELALTAHEGQTRMDGSPYVIHPLEVAEICVDLNMDEDGIIAAILHDTVEDTAVRLNQIRQMFGEHVARMVESLTKIKRIDFFTRFTGRNKASIQARNLQRLFVSMTRDTRVILIKLADRLHNMKTLGAMPDYKRQRISKETLEFYIPIARRLGLGQIVGDLEDLVFQNLYMEAYQQVQAAAEAYFKQHEEYAALLIARIRALLAQEGIELHSIYGRRKHLYSIWQKMQKQGVELEGIYDLLAIRIIIAGSAIDCYRAMGLIHAEFQPIFYRFRDFIASPKENGYQTLHTTVIGPQGTRIECQIRTREMDLGASKGVASHWSYKESETGPQHLPKDLAWTEFIEELASEDVDYEEFVSTTQQTLLRDQVLLLSPRGEVVNLPVGSTPLDFAYYIHTNLGHSARSAKVNGVVVPLDYQLNHGDMVEIIKSDDPEAKPRPEWLVFAHSPKSLLKIKRYYKLRPRAERISVGRSLLRQHIVKEGLYPLNLTANEKLLALIKQLAVRSIDDMYENVALGNFRCEEIVDKLKLIHRSRVATASGKERPGTELSGKHVLVDLAGDLGICLVGGKPLRRRTELMRCCTPVPGDKIYGVGDRDNRRVKVHAVNCPQLVQPASEQEMVELEWEAERGGKHYPARVRIVSLNRVGLLFEVMRFLSSLNINIGGAEFSVSPTVVSPDRTAEFELVLEVLDVVELERCLLGIAEIGDVIEVTRVLDAGGGPD